VTKKPAADELAAFAVGWFQRGLPMAISGEGSRALLNAAAAGIAGGSGEGARELEQALLTAHGVGGSLGLCGRGSRDGLVPEAAAHHVAFCVTQGDFDDAHLATIVHPGAAALGGILAAAAAPAALLNHGAQWLAAFALAVEVQLVAAVAVAPSHYEYGWHSTATVAGLGAATAFGLLVGLDEERLAAGFDRIALRSTGLREAHGTLMKGFQVGAAAAHGVRIIEEIAKEGVCTPLRAGPVLLGRSGSTVAIGDVRSPQVRTSRQGTEVATPESVDLSWELERLTYKPYPAGIVCNAGIDAAIELHREVRVDRITSVDVAVAPPVVELVGDPAPSTEMRARVSLPHAVAVGLLFGRAGLEEFSLHRIDDPIVAGLRSRTTVVADATLPRATAIVTVREEGAPTRVVRVDEPRGSEHRPLTDAELRQKASLLIEPVVPGRPPAILDVVERLAIASSGRELLAVLGGG
jgi:2-methylcitrate dehydratase PrpD